LARIGLIIFQANQDTIEELDLQVVKENQSQYKFMKEIDSTNIKSLKVDINGFESHEEASKIISTFVNLK
jgi:hypothetical protein